MTKTAKQLDAEIAEFIEKPRARSLFPSEQERAADYLRDGGFRKIGSGNTKRGESFAIYGSKNGSYWLCL